MRGFVTLAVGSKRYYKLALNLLKSYRHNSANPVPFAIIADRENYYTKQFDKVIILEKPTFSYMDKIQMLKTPLLIITFLLMQIVWPMGTLMSIGNIVVYLRGYLVLGKHCQ